jgi:phytoene dehydrogenase-like protein
VRPYATPNRSLFLCSASTPPGAGVHGMCGLHAAERVLANRRAGSERSGDARGLPGLA